MTFLVPQSWMTGAGETPTPLPTSAAQIMPAVLRRFHPKRHKQPARTSYSTQSRDLWP